MNLVAFVGAIEIGLVFGLVALGVFLSSTLPETSATDWDVPDLLALFARQRGQQLADDSLLLG